MKQSEVYPKGEQSGYPVRTRFSEFASKSLESDMLLICSLSLGSKAELTSRGSLVVSSSLVTLSSGCVASNAVFSGISETDDEIASVNSHERN